MTRNAQILFQKARKLPIEVRADFVDLLLDSIAEDDASARKKIDKAWAREAKSRFEAFLRGEISARPADEVMKTLRKKHVS